MRRTPIGALDEYVGHVLRGEEVPRSWFVENAPAGDIHALWDAERRLLPLMSLGVLVGSHEALLQVACELATLGLSSVEPRCEAGWQAVQTIRDRAMDAAPSDEPFDLGPVPEDADPSTWEELDQALQSLHEAAEGIAFERRDAQTCDAMMWLGDGVIDLIARHRANDREQVEAELVELFRWRLACPPRDAIERLAGA